MELKFENLWPVATSGVMRKRRKLKKSAVC